jgi:hypothetical protein
MISLTTKSKRKTQKRAKVGGSRVPRLRLLATAGGFPDRLFTTLTLSETGVSLTAANPSFGLTFALNSLISNMLGYLQLAEVYNKFLVRRSVITIMAANLSTTSPCRVNTVPVNEATSTALPTPTDDVFVDNPRAKNVCLSVLAGGTAARKFTNSVDVGRVLGFDKYDTSSYGSTGYCGGSNSSVSLTPPNDYWLWYLSAQTLDGTNLSTAVKCSVVIHAQVEFFDRLPKY